MFLLAHKGGLRFRGLGFRVWGSWGVFPSRSEVQGVAA